MKNKNISHAYLNFAGSTPLRLVNTRLWGWTFFAARVQRNPKKRTEKKIPTEYFKIHEWCSWIPEIQKIQTLRLCARGNL
jgi:hypothetical protein